MGPDFNALPYIIVYILKAHLIHQGHLEVIEHLPENWHFHAETHRGPTQSQLRPYSIGAERGHMQKHF